ncbi:MAG: alpha/beta fold hydrolase [Alteromonadaceae bacterium]|nr:alpha/beta fold hydrolase [Alteromonadaceae bacterium]
MAFKCDRKRRRLSLWPLLILFLLVGCNRALARSSQAIELFVGQRPVTVYHWQPDSKVKGTILFSHGAGSSPLKYAPLTESWVRLGYEVYAPLHVDSTDHPQTDNYKGLASWTTRLQDMQLLAANFGSDGYVAAGHSYGALTALVKGGAEGLVPPEITSPSFDPKVELVLAFSPPPAIPGFIEKSGYSHLAVPALIQTGTEDIPMGSATTWKGHLDAYDAATERGNTYSLVLDDVDHYFGGLICRPELPGPHQSEQMNQALDIAALILNRYAQQNMQSAQELTQRLGKHGKALLKRK